MTHAEAENIAKTSSRCTQATLRAFGIEGYPFQRNGTLQYLRNNGYKIEHISELQGVRLSRLFKYIETNGYNYLICTHGHSMALIDGCLVDTERKSFDNRIIENIWLVKKEVHSDH